MTAVVVGPRRPEQLRPALDALELDLSPPEREQLTDALRMSVLVLSEHDVRALLPMDECIEAMDDVLRSLARGELHQPLRFLTRPPDAESLMGFMPAHRGGEGSVWSLKEIVIAPGNPARGLDAHQGAVLLHDGETGRAARAPERLADHGDPHGRGLGGGDPRARASRRAGRRDPRRRRPGPLARRGDARRPRRRRDPHLEPRRRRHARGACCAGPTWSAPARAPASRSCSGTGWRAGTHVNAVGASLPTVRELDTETMAAASLFVDRRESTVNESGDLLLAGLGEEHIRAELGEVLIGAHPGRADGDELTVFKSLGLAVEDLAAAELIVRKAREQGIGTEVEF